MDTPDKTSVEKELAFLRRFAREFEQLDAPAQRRVRRYLTDRYGDGSVAPPSTEV